MFTMLVATVSVGVIFSCQNPSHHDGDAIRCENIGTRSMRLYGIDAPEIPGSCRQGRVCTPGDPFRSRDNLTKITAGKPVICKVLDIDRYKRPVVQCHSATVDISCAQVRDGMAVERYGRLRCQ